MQSVLTVAIITAYLAVLTFVALRARATGRFEEFAVARRALPLPLIFGSLAATYVGPGFSLAFVDQGYAAGYLFFFIALGVPLQKILTGLGVAGRLRQCPNCHTLGDVMGLKYNRSCQFMAGLISVGLCMGLAAVMARAGGQIITGLFDIPLSHAVIVMVALTAVYTAMGGLRASVVTDAFQFMSFAVLLPLIFLWLTFTQVSGGWSQFVQRASQSTSIGWHSTHCIEILGLVTAFFLGETLLPPYANRALASKSTQVSRNGFLFGGAFCVFWFLVMFSLGITASCLLPEGIEEDYILLNLVQITLPTELYALIMVVLISIVMSSLDSLLNAGAVSFTQDIVKPLHPVPDEQALRIGRLATLSIAALAAFFALKVEGILDGLLYCYTIWAPAILPALIGGLWIRRPKVMAGMLSMLVGVGVSLLSNLLLSHCWPESWPQVDTAVTILPSLVAAILAYVIGHHLSSQTEETRSWP